jgi:hypothetical protein
MSKTALAIKSYALPLDSCILPFKVSHNLWILSTDSSILSLETSYLPVEFFSLSKNIRILAREYFCSPNHVPRMFYQATGLLKQVSITLKESPSVSYCLVWLFWEGRALMFWEALTRMLWYCRAWMFWDCWAWVMLRESTSLSKCWTSRETWTMTIGARVTIEAFTMLWLALGLSDDVGGITREDIKICYQPHRVSFPFYNLGRICKWYCCLRIREEKTSDKDGGIFH